MAISQVVPNLPPSILVPRTFLNDGVRVFSFFVGGSTQRRRLRWAARISAVPTLWTWGETAAECVCWDCEEIK